LPGKFQILLRGFLGFLYDPVKDDDLFVQDDEKHPDNSLTELGSYLP